MATATEGKFGVHSEVGQLRKVMVCAPGRAMTCPIIRDPAD
jgi:arginine deiminase